MLRRIDGAWQSVAAITIADYLDTEFGFYVPERRRGFEIDGVPSKLDVCLATFDSVSTKHIGAPIAMRLFSRTPDATFFR